MGINLEETKGEEDDFKCLSYGTSLKRDNYAFIPNVTEEHVDTEKQRRVTMERLQQKFVKKLH